MKRAVITLSFTFLILSCYSQEANDSKDRLKKKKIVNYTVTGSMMLFAGIADGINQSLHYRYPGFKNVFPKANDQFWNPLISGANKYKNGDPGQGASFPGSRTWLVFLTDGNHLTRFAEHFFMAGAVTVRLVGYEKKKWYAYIIEAAGFWLINRAGFYLTYNLFSLKQ